MNLVSVTDLEKDLEQLLLHLILLVRRKSFGARSSGDFHGMSSTSQPCPRGPYATYVTPSSLAVSIRPSVSWIVSNAEYSAWTASILATRTSQYQAQKLHLVHSLALALRNVDAEHSESPIYLVFPAFRISSRAVTDSSNGVSVECGQTAVGIVDESLRTGIDPVEVVQIRSKAKSLDCALDIRLNMRSRIGHRSVASHAVEAALRSKCSRG